MLSEVPVWRQVYERLVAGLDSGEWPPGSPMPSARWVQEATGASRGTVVHAFSQLAEERRVTLVPGRGPFAARLGG